MPRAYGLACGRWGADGVTGAGVKELISAVGREVEEQRAQAATRAKLEIDGPVFAGSGNSRSW